MGIPKMFRWLSERYPLCSQLVEDTTIPAFDNLYLDMNGIIHNATHANRGAHQMLTDEMMFTSIFNYIDNLVRIIKPQRLLYMAVDGVAPRAKMNQQRARRFRTAMDRETEKQALIKKGEKVNDDGFDSNCITPGTEFMTQLTGHLQYFIHKKTSEDGNWRNLDIILSSHEVPGEGEHKIMEYIRLAKAQPNYEPNLRHCLYGLDADLIMLGLLSHEPHFALLREEVTFGRTKASGNEPPRFFLLHLSLVREYLGYDFKVDRSKMKFKFDTERIIDDFVMMIMFVGNDFLPHLPGFDIGEGVLMRLFNGYSDWLVKGDGYLNDAGTVHMGRLELFLRSLDHHEYVRYLKLPEHEELHERIFSHAQLTEYQSQLLFQIQTAFKDPHRFHLTLMDLTSFKDIEFITKLAEELELTINWDYNYEDPLNPRRVCHLLTSYQQQCFQLDDELIKAKEFNPTKFHHTMQYYLTRPIKSKQDEMEDDRKAEVSFHSWKGEYYKYKLKLTDADAKRQVVQSYMEGIQWVMYYYYRGIPSWSWYYPYHYSPMLSDLTDLNQLNIQFEKGTPFLPFQQLMGVLPSKSKQLVPMGYRELMTNPVSPIIDFYPEEFETDLNGKRNDWEAVVLIPFIDESRLLKAMQDQERLLTTKERARNAFGDSFLFRHQPHVLSQHIPSTFPGYFPAVQSRCSVSKFTLPQGPKHDLFTSQLCPGVQLGLDSPAGFPSLHVIPHSPFMVRKGIRVFDMPSKQETIALKLQTPSDPRPLRDIAQSLLGTIVHVRYPFLQEGKVMRVEGSEGYYSLHQNNLVLKKPTNPDEFKNLVSHLDSELFNRKAIKIEPFNVVVHVAPFVGLSQTIDGTLIQRFSELIPEFPTFPLSMVVKQVANVDARHQGQLPTPVESEYPLKSRVFYLGDQFYGLPSRVHEYSRNPNHQSTLLDLILIHQPEPPHLARDLVRQAQASTQHLLLRDLSRQLKCSPNTLSRLTSQIKLMVKNQAFNVGLGLKFQARNVMAVECCRKTHRGWEFSPRGCHLITTYCRQFPELIQFLDKQTTSNVSYAAKDVFGDQADTQVKAIRSWLTDNGVDKLTLSPVGSESLDKHFVMQIQAHWDHFLVQPSKFESSYIKGVHRSAVIRPSEPGLGLHRQNFELGNRVVCVLDDCIVPIGSKGTVIGKEPTRLEVLFNHSFPSATDLNGRCANHRGLWIATSDVLNLDLPQLTPARLPQFLARDNTLGANHNSMSKSNSNYNHSPRSSSNSPSPHQNRSPKFPPPGSPKSKLPPPNPRQP